MVIPGGGGVETELRFKQKRTKAADRVAGTENQAIPEGSQGREPQS